MFDTHCHLNFEAFRKDWSRVIIRTLKESCNIIIVGSNYKTSKRALKIAQGYKKGIYAAAGLHPIHTGEEKFNYEMYKKLVRSKKVVAVGETGIDWYHRIKNLKLKIKNYPVKQVLASPNNSKFKSLQKEVFLQHLKLAREVNLPVILHCRGSIENPQDAYREMLNILSSRDFNKLKSRQPLTLRVKGLDQIGIPPRRPSPFRKRGCPKGDSARAKRVPIWEESNNWPRGVVHCFSADWKIAQRFLKLGLYIGFTGVITFSNTPPELLEVVKKTPLKKILIETDAPYLSPEPHRGKRNEPLYLKYVARKIARIKNLSYEEVREATCDNAERLFKLK